MGNPAGVKRDFEALEKRRLKAISLLEKSDWNQSEVARRLQVCRQTVSRWVDQFQAGGQEALKKAARVGRKPETEADGQRLQELLWQGPEKLGYETPLWTGCGSHTGQIAMNMLKTDCQIMAGGCDAQDGD